MLIYADSSSLGDTHLSPTEGLVKLKEDTQKNVVDPKKLPGQALLENKEMAVGRALQPSEFIRLLQKANPKIIVEKGGYPNAVAVRYPTWNPDENEMQRKYISGFLVNDVMQEFSHITVDEKGLPHREVRGWRTVLIALNKAGILSFKDIKAVFGDASGQRSVLWDQQMREKKII